MQGRKLLKILLVMALLMLLTHGYTKGAHYSSHEIYSIHNSALYDEEYCVLVYDGDITFDSALSRIRSVLQELNYSEDWHALAYESSTGKYRVYFVAKQQPCSSLSDQERANVEIEYRIFRRTDDKCGPGGTDGDGKSCVVAGFGSADYG